MIRPSRSLFSAALLAVLSFLPAPAQDMVRRLDRCLQAYWDAKAFNGVALVADGGKILLEKGYGYANFEWNILNASDTRFSVGSVNKQFQAMAVMQLVEEGKLRLDGKVSDYLPSYRPDTGRKITLHHLLTHSSGLPWPRGWVGFSSNPADMDQVVKTLCSGDLEFEPGTRYKYSTAGFFLAAAIVQKVSGLSYPEYLARRILAPAGMTETRTGKEGQVIERMAAGYDLTSAGLTSASAGNPRNWAVATAIQTTARDLLRWDQALYGDVLLSRDGLGRVFTRHIATGEDLRGTPMHYGYGWNVVEIPDGERTRTIVRHTGGDGGFRSIIVRFTSDRKTIILLANVAVTPMNMSRIAADLEDILFDREASGSPSRNP